MRQTLASQEYPRILVMRSGAIGDTIVMSVVYQALRRHFPQAYIEALGVVERLYLINTPRLIDKITSLELPGIDAVFTEKLPLSPHLISYFHSFDIIIFYSFNPAQNLLCNAHGQQQIYRFDPFPPNNTQIHITTYLLDTLRVLGIRESNVFPQVVIPENYRASSASSPCRIAVHPGSGSRDKNWPIDNFVTLCLRVSHEYHCGITFIAGPAEQRVVHQISTKLSGVSLTILENRPLPEIAAELQRCDLYIGNDSGISHMAAAVGTPTIVIFGPSNPHIWRPLGKQVIVLYDETRQDCKTISVDQVFAEALNFL